MHIFNRLCLHKIHNSAWFTREFLDVQCVIFARNPVAYFFSQVTADLAKSPEIQDLAGFGRNRLDPNDLATSAVTPETRFLGQTQSAPTE